MDSTKDLTVLKFLAGDLESADQFTDLYESMLNEARITGDKEQVRQMQRILFSQCAFMVNEWIREEARIKECEERGQMQ